MLTMDSDLGPRIGGTKHTLQLMDRVRLLLLWRRIELAGARRCGLVWARRGDCVRGVRGAEEL
jgi:hypothetical protein